MSVMLRPAIEPDPVNPARVKCDFPVFDSCTREQPLCYLDNAATTHKPRAVIDAISRCYGESYGPIHRGLYPLAEQATNHYESARCKLQQFIGAPSPDQLVFTRSATEAINMVANGWLEPRLQAGDLVWVSRMEHHSNYLPWQRVCRRKGAELRIIELTKDGQLDLEGTPQLFSARTRLIAIGHVSNVLGVENPVAAISTLANQRGIPVLVDAAQSVSHLALDVSTMNCDFLAFSAHKMFGPTGIGLLYGKAERLAEMEPLQVGGGMVDIVGVGGERSQWTSVPARFEAGSPDMPGAVGFAAAAEYLAGLGIGSVRRHVGALTRLAAERLLAIDGVSLLPHAELPSSGIVAFTHRDLHPHDIAQIAGESGVAIRAGHHCAQPLLASLGLTATARASFSVYNDETDVEALVAAIASAEKVFGR
jgi:cysteine desulfurase/selenocysteine lyase